MENRGRDDRSGGNYNEGNRNYRADRGPDNFRREDAPQRYDNDGYAPDRNHRNNMNHNAPSYYNDGNYGRDNRQQPFDDRRDRRPFNSYDDRARFDNYDRNHGGRGYYDDNGGGGYRREDGPMSYHQGPPNYHDQQRPMHYHNDYAPPGNYYRNDDYYRDGPQDFGYGRDRDREFERRDYPPRDRRDDRRDERRDQNRHRNEQPPREHRRDEHQSREDRHPRDNGRERTEGSPRRESKDRLESAKRGRDEAGDKETRERVRSPYRPADQQKVKEAGNATDNAAISQGTVTLDSDPGNVTPHHETMSEGEIEDNVQGPKPSNDDRRSRESKRNDLNDRIEKKRPIRAGEKSIYIGNLPWDIRREELKMICDKFGDVYSITLGLKDFAFVMMDEPGANMAIRELNGRLFSNRPLIVRDAYREPGNR